MPDIRVDLPDGSAIDFPDGTPPDVMNRVAAEHWAKLQGSKPSTMDTVLTGVRGVLQAMGVPGAAPTPSRAEGQRLLSDQIEGLKGAGKGLLHTADSTRQLLTHTNLIPGLRETDALLGHPKMPEALTTPSNNIQRVGYAAEQLAENAIPAAAAGGRVAKLTANAPRAVRFAAQMATGAATNAATGQTQGHGREEIGRDAAIGAAGPVAAVAVTAPLRLVSRAAVSLARAALKTPRAMLARAYPDATKAGIDRIGDRLANTTLNNRLFNEGAATKQIDADMKIVNDELSRYGTKLTDAARREYLALQRLWRRYGAGEASEGARAQVKAKMDEILRGRFGKDAEVFVPDKPSAHFAQPRSTPVEPQVVQGEVVPPPVLPPHSAGELPPSTALARPESTAITPEVLPRRAGSAPSGDLEGEVLGRGRVEKTRVLRTGKDAPTVREVRAASLQQDNIDRAWMKNPETVDAQIARTMSSAKRDAVKRAVPTTEEPLRRAGENIKARDALRVMHVRDTNRDTVGLYPMAGILTANPKKAAIGLLEQYYKNNQLRLGIYARDIEKILQNGDNVAAGRLLQKLGVSGVTEGTR